MKIKDFIDKVENLYLGCSMETRMCCDYHDTIPQWIGVERYTFKDENGEDVILKRNSDNSYHTDSVQFNVMACFDMSGEMTICERPLRAQTAQGERVALSCSESIPAGSTMEIEITTLTDDLMNTVIEWLDYGKLNGLGQWHNSGKGRFIWEDITDKQ